MGERLRRAREAQGLKIEAVAAQLRIDVMRLQALERDDFSAFPAAVFVRGYVRGYARLLALPEAELIALYERQAAPSAVSLRPLPVTRYDKSERTILITTAGWAITLLVLLAGMGFWLTQYTWQDEQPPEASSSTPAAQAAAVIETPAPDITPDVHPVEATPPIDTLVLRFNADSWVEIYDKQGKTLLYELAPAGAVRSFEQPQLPFRVRLGNSSAVNIEYNGKVFDQSPYTRGNVANFTFDEKIAKALQAAEDGVAPATAE